MFQNKPIFGMIHLAGLFPIIRALEEIKILIEEGVEGCIVENYHGSRNEVVGALEAVGRLTIPPNFKVGVNILPNEFEDAFEISQRYNISFIQLDYVSGRYNNNKELNAQKYLELRKKYRIPVLGGVWPKYYTPVKESALDIDLAEAMLRAEAIVVTGTGTGEVTPLQKIRAFRNIIEDFPLIIGAGLTAENVKEQLQYADGGIVGSAFKPSGVTTEMIDRNLVREFMTRRNQLLEHLATINNLPVSNN